MENQEREISIEKLFWKLIFSWRCLLAWALVFMVLVPAVFYLKEYKSYQAALNWKPVTEEETSYVFTNEEKEQIQNAQKLQLLIDENEAYMDESVLMNMDPYEENVLVLQYYVESDYQFNYTEDNRLDYTPAVLAAYAEYVQSGELSEKLSESLKLECDKKYIQELLRVESSGAERTFGITLIYPDTEVLQAVTEIVKEGMSAQTARISQSVGSHSLKVLSENISVRTDLDLAAQKKTYQDMLYGYRSQLSTLKAAMTEEQLSQLGIEKRAAEETDLAEEEETAPVAVKPALHAKYVILGFVAGIFLAAVWIVCRLLFAGSLQDSEELTEIYGLRVFGVFKTKEKAAGLDRLLLKWKNRNKKQMTMEQNLDVTVSNIGLTCEGEGIRRIYFTGSQIEDVDKEFLKQITDRLKNTGMEVVYGENICYDAAALRKVTEIGYAVLVEQAGTSKYQEIKKEITIMTEQKVKILGCVGIDLD